MSDSVDDFESRIPLHLLNHILDVCSPFRIDPVSSVEAEAYFFRFVVEHREDAASLRSALTAALERDVCAMGHPPDWIQGPEWQFSGGNPMRFVGQLNRNPRDTGLHDEAAFYVFWSPITGETRTVVQVC